MMIERVELFLMKNQADINFIRQQKFEPFTEKWIDMDGTGQVFLKITYGTENPITDLNFYRIKHDKGRTNRIVSLFTIYRL